MKFRFFEFEDLPWFPGFIRESMTDYLRFLFTNTNLYEPVTEILNDALKHHHAEPVIDLCSGSGGPVEQVQTNYKKKYDVVLRFILTDKFPNVETFEFLNKKSNGTIQYIKEPVDAADVPLTIKGFRTIFSGFHHFDEDTARAVLKNAVRSNSGIAIFDGGDKNILIILGILVIHPILFFFCTPFIRPFCLSRIIFTYIIPVIPFCTIWDGVVSITRLYSPKQMLQLAKQADSGNYEWRAGKKRNKLGINVAYLVGLPKNSETVISEAVISK